LKECTLMIFFQTQTNNKILTDNDNSKSINSFYSIRAGPSCLFFGVILYTSLRSSNCVPKTFGLAAEYFNVYVLI